jgi:hypothetical protein
MHLRLKLRAAHTALALVGVFASHFAAAWSSQELKVSNDGVDSASCGSATAPCRSISQAIRNASASATIRVGPGVYGEFTGDLESDAGEEGPRTGRVAFIVVDKSLRILSTDGAEVTVIKAGAVETPDFLVAIAASGVQFGAAGHGFTLTGIRGLGLTRSDKKPPLNAIQVSGNIGLQNRGYAFTSYSRATNVVFSDNRAIQNLGGFDLSFAMIGDAPSGPVRFERNQASGNRGHGVGLRARDVVFNHNVIENNGYGVAVAGDTFSMEGNVIANNFNIGLVVSGKFAATPTPLVGRFVGNWVVGNGDPGIVASEFGTSFGEFERNNIYGNGTLLGRNCGLQTWLPTNVSAPNNYWGAAGGPGADPADLVCDQGEGVTTFAPFATTPFALDVPAF